jgi:hypothetical protein
MVEKRNVRRVLVGKLEGRENNIRICLEQIGFDGMDWMYLAENRHRDK